MNRTYELMFIVRPDMVDEDLNKLISTLESSVTSAGGTVKSEIWGKRRLAYRVGKFNDGIFVLMLIEAAGATVHEVERRLRVTEPVIKFLTVRTDEELKRLDKVKKLRDAKKKVSAQPAAAAPAPAIAVTPPSAAAPEAVTEAVTEPPASAPV
ncbi:MAG: 30S ribosomal protein S6 [Terriglobales bacterium]